MTLFPQAIPADLSGTLDGRLLGGRGAFGWSEEGVELRLPRAGTAAEPEGARIPFAEVEGLEGEARRVTITTSGRGTVVIEGDERVGATGAEIARRLFRLPELTRALRALGSQRGSNPEGAGHAAYFAPLLAARREAAALQEQGAVATAVAEPLRAERLRRAIAEGRMGLALRSPEGAPRRAMAARIDEACEPLDAALETLAAAETVLAAAPASSRAAAWRRWSGAVAHVFEMADRCWPVVDATLSLRFDPPEPPRRSWWRRSRGGGSP